MAKKGQVNVHVKGERRFKAILKVNEKEKGSISENHYG